MRARYAFGIPIAVCVALGITATVATMEAKGQLHTCQAIQPVYTNSAPYIQIGTWEARIPLGRSVTLPDGDTAACGINGEVTVR